MWYRKLWAKRILMKNAFIGLIAGSIVTFIFLFAYTLKDDVVIENVSDTGAQKQTKNRTLTNTSNKTCQITFPTNRFPHLETLIQSNELGECHTQPREWLFIDDKKILQWTDYAKDTLNLTKTVCSVTPFTLEVNQTIRWGKKMVITFGSTSVSKYEFVLVDCKGPAEVTGQILYWRYIFLSLSPKPNFFNDKPDKSAKNATQLSVYWFSFNSMSQHAFRRSFPKTIHFLENVMGSIVLNGYTVADNVDFQLLASLTGSTLTELKTTFGDNLDMYPFIWKHFKDAGYATVFGENTAKDADFADFNAPPTDHYPDAFFHAGEDFFHCIDCIGSQMLLKVWAQYGADFMKLYPSNVPKFCVLRYSHLNPFNWGLLDAMDDVMTDHLKVLYDDGYFDNAVVIISADHNRKKKIRERMPFMSVYLPTDFRKTSIGKQAFANLIANANVYTTPFDIYATFLNVLKIDKDYTKQNPDARAMSLFRSISGKRVC